jgi:hypothetical protein
VGWNTGDGSQDGDTSTSGDNGGDTPSPEDMQYHGGAYKDDSAGVLPGSSNPDVPNVPKGTAGSGTSVDTPSMNLFADNMDRLAELIKTAQEKVKNLPDAAPGAFKEAMELKKVLTGNGGLRENYGTVLHDLRQALMDTAIAIRNASKKYTTIEEASRMQGEDLKTLMTDVEKDFKKLSTDSL